MRPGKGGQGQNGTANSAHLPQAPGTAARSPLPRHPTQHPGKVSFKTEGYFGGTARPGGKGARRPRPSPAREGRPVAGRSYGFFSRYWFSPAAGFGSAFPPPKGTFCSAEPSRARPGAAFRTRRRFQVYLGSSLGAKTAKTRTTKIIIIKKKKSNEIATGKKISPRSCSARTGPSSRGRKLRPDFCKFTFNFDPMALGSGSGTAAGEQTGRSPGRHRAEFHGAPSRPGPAETRREFSPIIFSWGIEKKKEPPK